MQADDLMESILGASVHQVGGECRRPHGRLVPQIIATPIHGPMENKFKTTIDRLPELLKKNAAAMMQRMTAQIKAEMIRHDPAGNLAHAVLLLRVGEADLAVAFVDAVAETFAPRERGRFDFSMPMSLDLEEEQVAGTDPFASSTAAFDILCDTAEELGIPGVQRYSKDVFLGAVKDAFVRSRMDATTTEHLLPFVKTALDAELARLYAQLAALGRGRGPGGKPL